MTERYKARCVSGIAARHLRRRLGDHSILSEIPEDDRTAVIVHVPKDSTVARVSALCLRIVEERRR